MIIYSWIVSLIYLANALVMLNLIFRDRRNIQSTIGWLLILSLFPIGGFFMYIAFGRGMKKTNMFKLKKGEDLILKEIFNKSLEGINHLTKEDDRLLYKSKDMITTFLRLDNAMLTKGNEIDIYNKSDEFFDTLKNEIRKAKEFINIQYYIFKDDRIGKEIIDILNEKLSEGVEVRLLYDAVGNKTFKEKSLDEFKRNGGKVAIFFPSLFKFINFKVNYRNHRKIVVIDGKVGFVGGFNVGDEYLGRNKKFGNWRDTHLRLKGPAVAALNFRFLMDWRYASNEYLNFTKYLKAETETNGDEYVQIVSSGPDLDTQEIKYGYLKMIQRAKKYVYIQSPYFILDESLLEALKLSCLGGVDVRIMIPSKPDHPFVYWATYSYVGELLKFGAKIYLYDEKSFLHAKTVVIDDCICSIGTANMDIRSFELNFEVNAFIYSDKVSIRQREIFEEDILNSRELTQEIYDNRGRVIEIKESISRLLSPVL